ncbi:hypothetical protein [Desulfovibrio sp. MES5]|uniref:hypothetical protein n=1 Tax=Desulfovibrio sp. MES5 TaxID=1899016 RepID=UPI0025C50BAE|nr:hypothetical protein [Desulfovibrio sp. MES5]
MKQFRKNVQAPVSPGGVHESTVLWSGFYDPRTVIPTLARRLPLKRPDQPVSAAPCLLHRDGADQRCNDVMPGIRYPNYLLQNRNPSKF